MLICVDVFRTKHFLVSLEKMGLGSMGFAGPLFQQFILRLRPCRRPLYFGLLFLDVRFEIPVGICAGSLVFGSSFDAASSTINGECGSECCHFWYLDHVIWDACWLQFGIFGDQHTIQGSLGSIRRETKGPRLWFAFRDRILKAGSTFWANILFLVMLLSSSLC